MNPLGTKSVSVRHATMVSPHVAGSLPAGCLNVAVGLQLNMIMHWLKQGGEKMTGCILAVTGREW